MGDQAGLLRKMAWTKNRKASYIAITSGKGGVGKTNFAVNLAYQMAKHGKKILLFDADLGLANVDIILNIVPIKTIKDFILGDAKIDEIIVKNVKGFDVFPASSGFLELTQVDSKGFEKILDLFVSIDKNYDYIIFDSAAGIAENVIRFILFSDYFVVITLPEPTAITDAYALVKVVHGRNSDLKPYFVVNMAKNEKHALNVFENLRKVIKNFLKKDIEMLGFIKRDDELIKAVAKQSVLSEINPNSEYSKCVETIAKKLFLLQQKNNSIDVEEFLAVRSG